LEFINLLKDYDSCPRVTRSSVVPQMSRTNPTHAPGTVSIVYAGAASAKLLFRVKLRNVPALQASEVIEIWQPGPALALLAPARAITSRAFSPGIMRHTCLTPFQCDVSEVAYSLRAKVMCSKNCIETGDSKVARTRRQECLRYVAQVSPIALAFSFALEPATNST
jgi:hypothetical protein